ncbi:MAG: class I SAM-dependent methyltransferase [Candidatus Rifleibacteriota bacterium]
MSEIIKSRDPFIDLYNQRWALNYGDNAKKETPEFWNERAEDFARKAHSVEARRDAENFLANFDWDENETVLDVGAGPGSFAIPLARKVKKVVATDFSLEMLEQLKFRAAQENIENIEMLPGRWLELELSQTYDTVLCLNSFGVISTDANHNCRIIDSLKKLATVCSKRLIILIPHADSPLPMNLRVQLGLNEIALERKRIAILYCAMVDCGMLPDLRILKRPFRWTFKNMLEAVETLLIKAGLDENNLSAREKMQNYLQDKLRKEDSGDVSLAYNVSQALFVWEK